MALSSIKALSLRFNVFRNDYEPMVNRDIALDEFPQDQQGARQASLGSENALDECSGYDVDLAPFEADPDALQETQELTFRAILVGCLLGAIVSASNIYLGLKTGWTFGSSLFGAILGYAILKPVSKLSRRFGGAFGPKENVCVQTAATASGGLGIIFIGAIPAMYQLKLLGASPKEDFWKLIGFTFCTAFFGIFFSIGLRRFYILKIKLIFPTPTAVAHVIRALHKGGVSAQIEASRKAKVLAAAFFLAVVSRVASQIAPGLLWDWHIFYWLYSLGWHSMIAGESWGWVLEFTPAFFGAGILSGLNASLSFFGGSVLAWAIIGPLTVYYNITKGTTFDAAVPGMMNYNSLNLPDPVGSPSPRYWSLWIGVMMMTCASFAEIGCNAPLLFRGISGAMIDFYQKLGKRSHRHYERVTAEYPKDSDLKTEQIPVRMWLSGVVTSIVFSCLVLGLQFGVNPMLSLISILLAFVFAAIAVQSSGATDINPVSTCAKSSQLVIGGITQAQGLHNSGAQRINLISGVVAAGAAAQSVDMLGDLKTGYLLSASPRVQFYAQLAGSFCSIWLCTGFFLLFAEAYPCILTVDAEHCQFATPSVAAWRAVALAVTESNFPVPRSSWMTAVALGISCIFVSIAKYTIVPEHQRHWVPNMNAVGLAFTLPQTWFSTAMAIGSIVSYLWWKQSPQNWRDYSTSLAAGLCAGEGIGGVMNALLTLSGVDLSTTTIGCPGRLFCG